MKIGTKILILLLTLNFLSFKGTAQETNTKKASTEFDFSTIEKFRATKNKGQIINDYDHVFSLSQRKELADILYNYNVETTRQIVVVTIDNIKPYSDIQKYATDLGNYWGVGTAEKNNGLTIVLCRSCRQIGIATGYGTEEVLTDEICKSIIDNVVIPEFKNGNFYDGIKNGITELMKVWE